MKRSHGLVMGGLSVAMLFVLSGCGTSIPDISGTWNIKDVTNPATGTMTVTESSTGNFQGTMDMQGNSASVTGVVNKDNSVSLQFSANGQTLPITGTVNGKTINATVTYNGSTDHLVLTKEK